MIRFPVHKTRDSFLSVEVFFPALSTRKSIGCVILLLIKKNQNASRPSEHPPVSGGNVKTFRWDQRRLVNKKIH